MSSGGKRKNAGRPKSDPDLVKIPVSYRLPAWIVKWARSQEKASSVLIEEALCKTYKLKEPKK